MWGTFLSEPLRIVASVGRYPADQLMRRMPILHRRVFPHPEMPPDDLRGISLPFGRLSPCGGQVAYVLLTRAPVVSGKSKLFPVTLRLACVKPAASVHPEPGSNSPLLVSVFRFFELLCRFRISFIYCRNRIDGTLFVPVLFKQLLRCFVL